MTGTKARNRTAKSNGAFEGAAAHSPDAEQYVAGSLLIDGGLVGVFREQADWCDFYLPRERAIVRAILELHDGGDVIDAVTVGEQLQKSGQLKDVGGAGYIIELMDSVHHTGHVLRHSKTIAERSQWRKLYLRLVDAQRMLSDPMTILEDAVDFADGLTAHLDKSRAYILGEMKPNGKMIAGAKPPEFLIRNYITAGTLVVWSAPEKAWKTTLAQHVALVVCGHGKFLGLYEAVTGGPVIFFSGESGAWPLKSMQDRILDWVYPSESFGMSMKPDPTAIAITWGGDPPDLGEPGAIPALAEVVRKSGAKLLILDPSQALFGSIADEVKNDIAMRQYCKRLQLLARETGICIVLLHHFRQHVASGFPKRSDSSFGGFMKFCDTWVLMNQREELTGDEEPGSGKLWITWGSRDGFGATHAIDINEGTHETGRYFDLQVIEVDHAIDQVAERQAERKGQARKAASKANSENRKADIREALAGRETGVTGVTLAGLMEVSRNTLSSTIGAMLECGELVAVPVQYNNRGKICWQDGLALPENKDQVIQRATQQGWKQPAQTTGATPANPCSKGTGDTGGHGGGTPAPSQSPTGMTDMGQGLAPPGVVGTESKLGRGSVEEAA
jgi:hypothetical protein